MAHTVVYSKAKQSSSIDIFTLYSTTMKDVGWEEEGDPVLWSQSQYNGLTLVFHGGVTIGFFFFPSLSLPSCMSACVLVSGSLCCVPCVLALERGEREKRVYKYIYKKPALLDRKRAPGTEMTPCRGLTSPPFSSPSSSSSSYFLASLRKREKHDETTLKAPGLNRQKEEENDEREREEEEEEEKVIKF